MFKVGQLVWCKKKNRYGATDYHVKCKVVYTSDEEKKISEFRLWKDFAVATHILFMPTTLNQSIKRR